MLGSLSALLSVYAVFVVNTAPGFLVHDYRLRADTLVSAAVELTAYRQLNTPAQSRQRSGQFNFKLDRANATVEFRSETSRIDLNAASKPLLTGLFVALGARGGDAELYSDRIIAWRTAPQTARIAGPWPPRLGRMLREDKFPHAYELSLVPDIPPGLIERALPFVTVYSGRPQVNILDAAPEVIAALPAMTWDRVHAVLAQRQLAPDNIQFLNSLLGPAQQFTTIEGSRALRVNVAVALDGGYRATTESVILLFEEGSEPYSVLSWHNASSQAFHEPSRKIVR